MVELLFQWLERWFAGLAPRQKFFMAWALLSCAGAAIALLRTLFVLTSTSVSASAARCTVCSPVRR